MTDRELKSNIKKTKDFIALWVKFHDLYKDATKKETITQEEEKLFLETKSLIAVKYEALKHALKLNASGDKRMMDVISHVLSLKGMAAISDKALVRIEESWNHSHGFLNKRLKDLENQSRGIWGRRSLIKFLKNIFSNKVIQVSILIAVIFIMFYAVNVLIGIVVK